MPIAPAVTPVLPVPPVATALGYPLDRRVGVEFGWESLLWHEGSGLNRDRDEGHQSGEYRNDSAHVSLQR
jgi:hypothetical protein